MESAQDALIRQYCAALAMLRAAIEACPEPLWEDPSHPNPFWRVAAHTVFYTHLYLHHSEKGYPPLAETVCTKAEVLESLDRCAEETDSRVRSLDLDSRSGFHWLPCSRLEVHLYNLRHLAHHAGQLIDRVRGTANVGIVWKRGL